MIGRNLADNRPETIQKEKAELMAEIERRGWDVNAYKFGLSNGYDPISGTRQRRLDAWTGEFKSGVWV